MIAQSLKAIHPVALMAKAKARPEPNWPEPLNISDDPLVYVFQELGVRITQAQLSMFPGAQSKTLIARLNEIAEIAQEAIRFLEEK